jgi:hypothetical protein
MRMERRTNLEKVYKKMMVEEECEEDAPIFAHNGLWVPINICFDQIEGFTLHLREGINLWPVALLDNLPPDI